jgi:hypothetical protein
MLKTAVRVSGIGLAVCGLAVALAPAAGATPVKPPAPAARPVTQTLVHASGFQIYSPCDGSLVTTSGTGEVVTVTTGQRTTVAFNDDESGDGFVLALIGGGSFAALSSTYPVTITGVWLDLKHPADSFHASFTATLDVTATNAPSSINVTGVTPKCGL